MFIEATFCDPTRIDSVNRMCRLHGTYLGKPYAAGSPEITYHCVDGKVWLLHPRRVVRLGDYADFCEEVRRGIRKIRK